MYGLKQLLKHPNGRALLVLVAGVTVMSAATLTSSKVYAGHDEWVGCGASELSVSPAGPPGNTVGNGYVWRTIKVKLYGNPNSVGHRAVADCTLHRNPGNSLAQLEYYGLYADEVWFGFRSTTYQGANGWAPGFQVNPCPNVAGVSCQANSNTVAFQDDAAAVFMNGGGPIFCHGMIEFCNNPGGPNSNVYVNGWEGSNPNANRGAGFFDMGFNTQVLAVGNFSTFPITAFVKNTWTGNNTTEFLLTLRYRQNPPPVSVEGRMFDVSNGGTITSSILIETCTAGQHWTQPDGFFRISIPTNQGFCLRPVSTPPGYASPPNNRTYPWGEGYLGCPANTLCNERTYENQMAGGNAGNGWDRWSNIGYDMAFVPYRRVEGRIWNEFTGVGIPGVQVETCTASPGANVWTDGAGFYRFDVPLWDWHCARVVGGVPGNLDPATTRTWPWAEGYAGCAANTTCWHTTYEWQMAGGDFDGGGWDRARDNGFDFHIRPRRPPTGGLNGINCNWMWGNASDPDYSGSIRVHIYVDGPRGGGGTYAGQAFTDGAGNWTFNVSPWQDYGTRSFYAYGIGSDVNGNPDGYDVLLSGSPATTPAPGCALPTCGPVSSTPANPQPGQAFTLRARFLYNPGSQGRPISQSRGHIMSLSVTPGVYNNANQPYVAYDPVSGYPVDAGTATVNGLVAPTAGSYNVNMFVSNVNFVGCGPSQVIVASRPYFRAYGGDVASGYNFLASPSAPCSATPGIGRRIIGWNDGAGSGSGVELAAFALGLVDQFSSATVRLGGAAPDTGPPFPAKGATFANTGNADASSTFGGGLGMENENCPHNYFAYSAGNTFVNVPPGIGVNLASPPYTTNGIYYRDSNAAPQPVRISGTTLPAGRRVTIFVNHDVRLESDINYATNWADITQIPNLTVIVRGNIYIPPGTRNLSGIFIAQDDGTGTKGRIYTCTNSSGDGAPSASDLMPGGPCANKLTVFGSFIAESLRLFRASGTQITSSGPQEYTDSNISEAFIFSPEVWLAAPKFGNSTRDDFDSYTSMPPVF